MLDPRVLTDFDLRSPATVGARTEVAAGRDHRRSAPWNQSVLVEVAAADRCTSSA
jgi:hypothetical protein